MSSNGEINRIRWNGIQVGIQGAILATTIGDWRLLNRSKLTDGRAKNRAATRLGDGTG
jgi:hypothetical protein